MKICPNCSTQSNDDASFCQVCGFQFTKNDAQPTQNVSTPVCETPQQPDFEAQSRFEQPIAPAAPEKTSSFPGAKPKAKSKKPLIFGIIGAVFAVLLIVAAIVFIPKLTKKPTTNYALYVKDYQMFFTDFKKNAKPWQLTSSLVDKNDVDNEDLNESSYVFGVAFTVSKDGKLIFYYDKCSGDGDSLYYRSIKKPEQEPVKIGSDVNDYYVTEDASTIYYSKTSDDTATLYKKTLKDDNKEKLADNVSAFFVSSDETTVLILDDDYGIYIKEDGKDKEKIASDASVHHLTEDLSLIIYSKDNAIYKYEKGKDTEKLVSDATNIYPCNNNCEFYYSKTDTQEVPAMNYVIDDMKDSDAAMQEPEYPSYPYWWDYDTDEEYYAAQENYQKASDAYYEARSAYYEKLQRDELRQALSDAKIKISKRSLYFFDGSESTLISDSFINNHATSYESQAMVFSTSSGDASKVKLSEITSANSLEYDITAALNKEGAYNIACRANVTTIDSTTAANFTISPDGTAVYYIDNVPEGKKHGELFQISIKDGKADAPVSYDTDVCLYSSYFINNELFYFKDVNDNQQGDLYNNKEKIDSDVSVSSVKYNEILNAYFYETEWNDDAETYTLKMRKNNESIKIADDVNSYTVTPTGDILYLNDFSTRSYKGTLNQWTKNGPVKIDDDVVCLVMYVSKENRLNFLDLR